MWANNDNRPETLLAIVDAAAAERVVRLASPVIQEERPFQTPLLAHSRHFHAPICRQSVTLRQTVKL